MGEVELCFDRLGVTHAIIYQPPANVGGYVQRLDLVSNIFELWRFQVGPEKVFDCIDRAIGTYERESRRLFRSSFNPLYWLQIVFMWLLRSPFKLLGAAGFNAKQAEESIPGKLLKVAIGIVPFTAAALYIAERWSTVQQFLRVCAAAWHHLRA